jgi:hypothetical protein
MPNLVGNGLLLKRLSRSPSLTNGGMKFLLPPLQVGTPFGTSTRCRKETIFLWSVIHKVVAVNEWHGQISVDIDKSCPHGSPLSVELMEHVFFNCPLAQHVWRYATNIIYQLFAKRGNLGPHKSCPLMQCLFDRHLSISSKTFKLYPIFLDEWPHVDHLASTKCFDINATHQLVGKKVTHQIVWDNSIDYGRLQWQNTYRTWKRIWTLHLRCS